MITSKASHRNGHNLTLEIEIWHVIIAENIYKTGKSNTHYVTDLHENLGEGKAIEVIRCVFEDFCQK